MKFNLSDLRYTILPARFCAEEFLPLYDRAFNFWFENWTKVFQELQAGKGVNADDFFRQDFVPVITYGEQLVAIHLYTLFDFRAQATLQHSYIKSNFNPAFVEACRERGLEKLMSMESIFANPDFRKSVTGINFPRLMASLGQKIFTEHTDAQAIFAPARADIKVSASVQPIGFEILQPNVILNNVPVDFIICMREKIQPPPGEEQLLVQRLWRGRTYADRPVQGLKAA